MSSLPGNIAAQRRQKAELQAVSNMRRTDRAARHARILAAIVADELDRQEVAERFSVSLRAAQRLITEARRGQP